MSDLQDKRICQLEQQLKEAYLHIAQLILWTGGIPDKDGDYTTSSDVYKSASAFLREGLSLDRLRENGNDDTD